MNRNQQPERYERDNDDRQGGNESFRREEQRGRQDQRASYPWYEDDTRSAQSGQAGGRYEDRSREFGDRSSSSDQGRRDGRDMDRGYGGSRGFGNPPSREMPQDYSDFRPSYGMGSGTGRSSGEFGGSQSGSDRGSANRGYGGFSSGGFQGGLRPYDIDRPDYQRGDSSGGGSSRSGSQQGLSGSSSRSESFAGKGPKSFKRNDDRIRENVCECLEDDHDIDASDVEVAVKEGEVSLTGTVATREMKRLIEDRLERFPGVRDVNNQLRVKSRDRQDQHGSEKTADRNSSGSSSSQGNASKSSSGAQTTPR